MPRDGTGQYNLPDPAVVTNTLISSADENATRNDMAAALTGSLPRDGQGAMTGNLLLGGFRAANLAAPAAASDAARRDTVAWERLVLSTGAVAQATVDIAIPAGMRRVRLTWQDTSPASAAQFALRISTDSGATYRSGASDYGVTRNDLDGATNSPSSASAAQAPLTPNTTGKTSGCIEIGVQAATQMDFRAVVVSTAPALVLTTGVVNMAVGPATNIRLFFTGGINVSTWNFLLEGQRT